MPKCLNCKITLKDFRSIRCRSCAGKLNRPAGRKTPMETRIKMSKAQKGRIGYWKGKKRSLEARRKNSESHKRLVLEGKCHLWKGGIYPANLADRVRFRQQIQKQVLERDNFTCQLCGIKGVYLHVDHIQPWAEYIEQRFNINNCRTLCVSCHYKITFGKPMPENSTWGYTKKMKVVTQNS